MKIWTGGIISISLLGCAAPIPKEPVRPEEPVFFQQAVIPQLMDDDADRTSLQMALEKSLAQLARMISTTGPLASSSSRPLANFLNPERTYRSLALFREILLRSSDWTDFDKKLRESFTFWEPARGGRAGPILLTGYYEPIIDGSLKPGGEYLYPIYRRPDDLVELTSGELSPDKAGRRLGRFEKGQPGPYYSRREIDSHGVLRGKGYELAWLKDSWERFVLHVQGSGQIRLPEGTILRVGYAASNGYPYRSIGRYLVEQGILAETELSLRRVQEFLRENPDRMQEIFNVNERYIFFRVVPGKEGPIGALGVPLTAGRSIATDLAIFPPGGLAYLIAKQPVLDEAGKLLGRKTIRRFVLNQDTGAAMKGPERVDFFCGSGERAGMAAGQMREEGRIFFLLAE